jgi:hypothetical protein
MFLQVVKHFVTAAVWAMNAGVLQMVLRGAWVQKVTYISSILQKI